MKPIPTDLLAVLEYKDGKVYWAKSVNARASAGKKVGTLQSTGYVSLGWKGKSYYLHRVVYAMHYGDTSLQIDHINQDKTDNSIENLRAVNQRQNLLNQHTGVTKLRGDTWRINAGRKYLGSTNDLFEAWCIRKSFNNMEISNG